MYLPNRTVQSSNYSNASKIAVPLLSNVAMDVLKLVDDSFQEKGTLSDADILKLYTVFGTPFEKAMELLDKKCVTYFHAENCERFVIQVVGSTGIPYTLFPKMNYCQCPAYNFHVLKSGTNLTCKHVLVARLSEIMGKGRHLQISGEQLSQILCSAVKLET